MRWFILVIGLMVSFPVFATEEKDWKWIVICEVFSENKLKNVEVFRETFDSQPGVYGRDGFNASKGSFTSRVFYFGWGARSCIIMNHEAYEHRDKIRK